jgi:hypothetical protein
MIADGSIYDLIGGAPDIDEEEEESDKDEKAKEPVTDGYSDLDANAYSDTDNWSDDDDTFTGDSNN